MDSFKKVWAVLVVVALIATTSLYLVLNIQKGFGGVTNYDALELSSGLYVSNASSTLIGKLQVGSTGTALKNRNEGLGYIYPYAALIPASTTKLVDLQATSAAGTAGAISALTGVQANDFCSASLSTTTAGTTYGGLKVVGVGASTTNGFITLAIQNGTGQDFTWPITTNASGTAYYICSRP